MTKVDFLDWLLQNTKNKNISWKEMNGFEDLPDEEKVLETKIDSYLLVLNKKEKIFIVGRKSISIENDSLASTVMNKLYSEVLDPENFLQRFYDEVKNSFKNKH